MTANFHSPSFVDSMWRTISSHRACKAPPEAAVGDISGDWIITADWAFIKLIKFLITQIINPIIIGVIMYDKIFQIFTTPGRGVASYIWAIIIPGSIPDSI